MLKPPSPTLLAALEWRQLPSAGDIISTRKSCCAQKRKLLRGLPISTLVEDVHPERRDDAGHRKNGPQNHGKDLN
jgi:hypothetical protein